MPARRSTPASGAGWIVQSRDEINLSAGRGVAIREFKLASGYGFADYPPFVDSKPVGVLEAKPEGFTLTKSVAGIKSVLRRSQERRALCCGWSALGGTCPSLPASGP